MTKLEELRQKYDATTLDTNLPKDYKPFRKAKSNSRYSILDVIYYFPETQAGDFTRVEWEPRMGYAQLRSSYPSFN